MPCRMGSGWQGSGEKLEMCPSNPGNEEFLPVHKHWHTGACRGGGEVVISAKPLTGGGSSETASAFVWNLSTSWNVGQVEVFSKETNGNTTSLYDFSILQPRNGCKNEPGVLFLDQQTMSKIFWERLLICCLYLYSLHFSFVSLLSLHPFFLNIITQTRCSYARGCEQQVPLSLRLQTEGEHFPLSYELLSVGMQAQDTWLGSGRMFCSRVSCLGVRQVPPTQRL